MSDTPQTAKEIIYSLPERFRKDRAEGEEFNFHFDISGDNGGQFTVNIANQQCTVSDGLNGEANCEVKTKDSTYEDIELGRTNPQMAFLMGKIKISDLGNMMTFISLFDRLYDEED